MFNHAIFINCCDISNFGTNIHFFAHSNDQRLIILIRKQECPQCKGKQIHCLYIYVQSTSNVHTTTKLPFIQFWIFHYPIFSYVCSISCCVCNWGLYRYCQRNTSYILSFIGRRYSIGKCFGSVPNHLQAIYIRFLQKLSYLQCIRSFWSNYLSVFMIFSCNYTCLY
jgi:hypothetical protein